MNIDTSKIQRLLTINQAFKPSSPIDQVNLFAGRVDQIDRMVNAITQTGLHVILYGERGVGKTSLVSILRDIFSQGKAPSAFLFTRINCEKQQTFGDLWKHVLSEIKLSYELPSIGLSPDQKHNKNITAFDLINSTNLAPEDIRILFEQIPLHPVIILDELDRISDPSTISSLADTVKTLSDHSSRVTLILVGVADSVNELLGDHLSVIRAIVQIPLPRMSNIELHEVLDKSLREAQMTMLDDAKAQIVNLSKGLPHYTHLLGLHAARRANDDNRSEITIDDLVEAIKTATEEIDQSLKSNYVTAIQTSRKATMHEIILLACAIAQTNELGFFTAGAVKQQLTRLTGKTIEIGSFALHLTDFSSDKRGNILQRKGKERNYQYRFVNTLMQPYVIMRGIEKGLIRYETIEE